MQFPTNALPPALLDLTLLRVAGPSTMRVGRTAVVAPRLAAGGRREYSSRQMHQAAMATAPPPPPQLPPRPLPQFAEYARNPQFLNPVSEEDVFDPDTDVFANPKSTKKDKALAAKENNQNLSLSELLEQKMEKLAMVVESEKSALQEPTFTEEELQMFYEDVLAVPQPEPQVKLDDEKLRLARAEEDYDTVEGAHRRLLTSSQTTGAIKRFDSGEATEVQSQDQNNNNTALAEMPMYKRVLTRAHEIVTRIASVREKAMMSTDGQGEVEETEENMQTSTSTTKTFVPIAVLSPKESEALVRMAIHEGDPDAAEQALSLMKQAGLSLPENAVTEVIKLYADLGHPDEVEKILKSYLTHGLDETQRHLHVKAYLNATPRDVALPNDALNVLHHYESLNTPAPMKTYTLIVSRLFMSPSSLARAHGWDLFTHMRYVAHPDPDCKLFTVMIRACANPLTKRFSSEPEKALDLWTEMTVDHQITPTRAAYNAVILACARSGEKEYVHEAFRLSRQMLDAHRDAAGVPAYRPDKKTFCALMEGAKRVGDLGRVRWILAEMVKAKGEDIKVDEEAMMHVFHAYATYKPPFNRAATKILEEKEPGEEAQTQEGESVSSEPESKDIVESKAERPFSQIPPQSAQEVISEAEYLFKRILEDSQSPSSSTTFSDVKVTPRLLNSYLSIFYKHSTLGKSRELFWRVFEECRVERTARTYVEALERCGYQNSRRKGLDSQEFAVKWAEEMWEKWGIIEQSGRDGGKRLYARLVERAHVALMRTYTLAKQSDRALAVLREFEHRYPPQGLRENVPKPLMRSSRTSLVGARPLVRMTADNEVPDDFVPPMITFHDIELLHHRLLMYNRKEDIGYLTYLCRAYEWALRVRRDETMKAKPQPVDLVPTAI